MPFEECYKKFNYELSKEIASGRLYQLVKSIIGIDPVYASTLSKSTIEKKLSEITKKTHQLAAKLPGIPVGSDEYYELILNLRALKMAYDLLDCIKNIKQTKLYNPSI